MSDLHIKYFKINRSNILKEILLKKGWKEAKDDADIDFSYWDTFSPNIIKNAEIMVIPRHITNIIDDKKSMYTTLLKNNLIYFLPKTYTDLVNINPNIFNENKIFFLKKKTAAGGKDVYAIFTIEKMKELICNNYYNFILQEEVPEMLLHNGFKTSLRIYVLITKISHYIYKEGRLYVYSKKYCKNDMSDEIHNDVWNSTFYNFTDQSYYDIAFLKIKDICNKSSKCFFKKRDIDNNKFIILGYDFILNNQYKPYLIEVNAYPNLHPCCSTIKNQNTKMLNDFVNLYIEPKYNKKCIINNNWIKL